MSEMLIHLNILPIILGSGVISFSASMAVFILFESFKNGGFDKISTSNSLSRTIIVLVLPFLICWYALAKATFRAERRNVQSINEADGFLVMTHDSLRVHRIGMTRYRKLPWLFGFEIPLFGKSPKYHEFPIHQIKSISRELSSDQPSIYLELNNDQTIEINETLIFENREQFWSYVNANPCWAAKLRGRQRGP